MNRRQRASLPKICRWCRWWRPLSDIQKAVIVCHCKESTQWLHEMAPGDGCSSFHRRRDKKTKG